ARFNVQVASVERWHFVGLPIPAGAAVIASTVLLYYYLNGQGDPNKHVLMLLVIYAVPPLMVSEFRYLSFKEVKLHRRHPFPVLLGLIVLIMLTIGAPEVMLFVGITSYALSAPAMSLWRLARRRPSSPPVAAPSDAPLRPVVLDKPGTRS